ncbi:MAG: T9SS type A sorting domain-containing protein [Bacteroidota bacterium]
MRYVRRLQCLLVLLASSGLLQAQTLPAALELTSPNAERFGFFGWSVSDAGDVNADGFTDVIVGSRNESPGNGPFAAGRAYVYSGADGALLYTLVSPNEEENGIFGEAVSGAGDVDRDGFDDVIVGAPGEDPGVSPEGAGRAYIFSGFDGSLLYTLASPNEEEFTLFGRAVSDVGDVNFDGRADVLVGAPGDDPGVSPNDAGRAYVFSGLDGSLLYTLASPNEQDGGQFGFSASGAGDVNNDDINDVVVGAFFEDPGASPTEAGRAYVFNGTDGSLLYTLVSPNEEFSGDFGYAVSGAGDVNNDTFDDVIVGAREEDPDTSPGDAGRAYIFSGADGTVLYTLASPNEEVVGNFGGSVSDAGDVNNDGVPDVIVGAPGEDPGTSPDRAGRAYVFSGADGTVLNALASPNEEEFGSFGWTVSGLPDLNNDALDEVIVGAYAESPVSDSEGRAYVFTPPTPVTLGGPEGWTTVAPPGNSTFRSDFFEPIWTQGSSGADASDGDPNVFVYDETAAAGDRNAGYVAADLSIGHQPGQGYLVYAFEDDFLPLPGVQGAFPKTLNAVGLDANAVTFPGDFGFPVTFTDTGAIGENGWNLVGGPFASGLDWDAAGWTKTSVDNLIYVYDPATTTYKVWNGSVGDLGSGVLAAGQAFWVKANAAAPGLVAPLAARAPGGGTLLARQGHPEAGNPESTPLAIEFAATGTVGTLDRADAAFIHFDEAALTGADPLDAYELAPFASTYLSLFTEDIEGTLRDILALPAEDGVPYGAPVEVPLGVWAVAEGQFASADLTLTWPTVALPDGWTATLFDTATGTEIDLLSVTEYRFTATPGAQGSEAPDVLRGRTAREAPPVPTPLALDGIAAEGRRAAQRFVVTVAASGVDAEDSAAPLAFGLDAAYPNPFTAQTTVAYTLAEASAVRLTVYDALGREVAVLADGRQVAGRHAASFDGQGLASGVYVVRLEAGTRTATQTLIVVR